MVDVLLTLQIIFIATIALHVLSAWDYLLDDFLVKKLNLDRERLHSSFILAIIYTLFFLIVLYFLDIEAHELLGLPELLDSILTRTKETIVNGKIIHTPF